MSVYENPELLPIFNRIIILQLSISAILGLALGYWFAFHQSNPLVEMSVTAFTSNVMAIDMRFDELNRYDGTSGYFYIGCLIVAIPSAVIGSIFYIAAYMKVVFLKGHSASFDSRSAYGFILIAAFTTSLAYLSILFDVSPIGSNSRDGVFLSPFFALLLPCTTFSVSGTVLSATSFLVKLIARPQGRRPDSR